MKIIIEINGKQTITSCEQCFEFTAVKLNNRKKPLCEVCFLIDTMYVRNHSWYGFNIEASSEYDNIKSKVNDILKERKMSFEEFLQNNENKQ